ncbi:12092_t:CDS:2 [Acaulospora colombiana]|uniref:12092_t:CDS:1 n=1 Tax=Acaulospora colombiana TaxID=27376 RepID=A0ACA9KFK3_9GLOM|nr:12092_t:CDS:2 [Acaulospora colombiana]
MVNIDLTVVQRSTIIEPSKRTITKIISKRNTEIMYRILNYLLILVAAVTLAYGYPSPSDPYGSTVWTSGQQVTIDWSDVGSPPTSSFKGICVKLMTGPDIGQIYLMTLAPNLSDSTTSLTITVPSPKSLGYPPGHIYFIMFSDAANPDQGISWSTRFSIVDSDSQSTVSYDPKSPWTISLVVTAFVTSSTATDTSTNSPTQNVVSGQNTSGSVMSAGVWNVGIITLTACVAFAFVI